MVRKFVLLFVIAFCFLWLPAEMLLASTTDGTISGYGWSSYYGWVNFGTTNGNSHITDSAVTGYAWNQNAGRINLNPSTGGILNNAEGTLSGRAWLEGAGWINFSGVTVNSSGVFSGTATGDNNANITFNCTNCNVHTDWRPASSRTSGGGSGGSSGTTSSGGGGGAGLIAPVGTFGITINGGAQYTNNQQVALTLENTGGNPIMEISNTPDFTNSLKEPYQKTKLWNLGTGDGQKRVYARFYNQFNAISATVSASIILDTSNPFITLTSPKSSYSKDEEITIFGTAEALAQVTFFIDGSYGALSVGQNGAWVVNLGKLGQGSHRIEFTAKDAAQNQSPVVAANFSVDQSGVSVDQNDVTLAPSLPPILRELAQGLQNLFPNALPFLPKTPPPVKVAVTVPTIAPAAFKLANNDYISPASLSEFVLAPLPQDITLLAQKFPQVQKTLTQVGVTKITDVPKLANANLNLPNLTEAVFPQSSLAVGKFAVPKGIPIANLSAIAKSRIPSEIVFAKVGGGLVDLNAALSINTQGKTTQQIETVSGKPLQLVVRPERPVKSVIGYIVFNSKKPSQPQKDAYQPVSLNSLSASLIFSYPDLTSPISESSVIAVEGQYEKYNSGLSPAALSESVTNSNVERRLVLGQFEYHESGNGVYVADIQAPTVDGEYEVVTVMDYRDSQTPSKEIKLLTVVDPDGYVYEKNGNNSQTRIAGAIVTLYWLDPKNKQYEIWPAKEFQQENPQVTDTTGQYSLLVPASYYYIKVDAPGYLDYTGKSFQVLEGGGVHSNIELTTQYWFLKIADWKSLLFIIVICLLLYNFYKDKMRDKIQKTGFKNNLKIVN